MLVKLCFFNIFCKKLKKGRKSKKIYKNWAENMFFEIALECWSKGNTGIDTLSQHAFKNLHMITAFSYYSFLF